MANRQFQTFTIQNVDGSPAAGATFTVTQVGSAAPATIYAENGTVMSNPGTISTSGSLGFAADAGTYEITVRFSNCCTQTITRVFADCATGGGGSTPDCANPVTNWTFGEPAVVGNQVTLPYDVTFCDGSVVTRSTTFAIPTPMNATLAITNDASNGDGVIEITVTPNDGTAAYVMTLPEPTLPETAGVHFSGQPTLDGTTGIVTFPTVNDFDETPAAAVTVDLSALISSPHPVYSFTGDITVSGTGTAADPFVVNYVDSDLVFAPGANVTFTGAGTPADPIVVNSQDLFLSWEAAAADGTDARGQDYLAGATLFNIPNTTQQIAIPGFAPPPNLNAVLSITNGNDGDGDIVVTVTPNDGTGQYALTFPEPPLAETAGVYYSGQATIDASGVVTFPTRQDLDDSPAAPVTLDLSSLISPDPVAYSFGGDLTVSGTGTAADPFLVEYTDADVTYVAGQNITFNGAGTAADPIVIAASPNATLAITNPNDGDGVIVVTVTPNDGTAPYDLTFPEPTLAETSGVHFSGQPTIDANGLVTFPTVDDLDESVAAPVTLDLSSLISPDPTVYTFSGDITVTGSGTAADPFVVDYTDNDLVFSAGSGITFTGAGTAADPIVIAAGSAVDTDTTLVANVAPNAGGGVDLTFQAFDQIGGTNIGAPVTAACLQERLLDSKGNAIPKDTRVARSITVDTADPANFPAASDYDILFNRANASFYGCGEDAGGNPIWLSQDRGDLSCYNVGEDVGGTVIDAADTATWPTVNYPYILSTGGDPDNLVAIVLGDPTAAGNVKRAGGGSVEKDDLVAIDQLSAECVKTRDATTGQVTEVGIQVDGLSAGQSVTGVEYRTKVGFNAWSAWAAIAGTSEAVANDPVLGQWTSQFRATVSTPCGDVVVKTPYCFPDENPLITDTTTGANSGGNVGNCVLFDGNSNPQVTTDTNQEFLYEGSTDVIGGTVGYNDIVLTNTGPGSLPVRLEQFKNVTLDFEPGSNQFGGADPNLEFFQEYNFEVALHNILGRTEDVPNMFPRSSAPGAVSNLLGTAIGATVATTSGERMAEESFELSPKGDENVSVSTGNVSLDVVLAPGETKTYTTRTVISIPAMRVPETFRSLRFHVNQQIWAFPTAPEMAVMADYNP